MSEFPPPEASGPPPSDGPQPFSLLAAARLLRRALPVIVGGAAGGALLALLWSLLMTPALYLTSATLLVPPSLAGEDNIGLLTVQGYLELAQSPEIVDQAWQRASTALGLELDPPVVGRHLKARRVGADRTSEANRLLVLEARWTSAVGAAALASGWANALQERCQSLAAMAGIERGGRWEEKLVEAQDALAIASLERRELIDGLEVNYRGRAEMWRRKLSEHRARTFEQLAEYEREQQRRLAETERDWSLSSRRLKAEASRARYVTMLQNELAPAAWDGDGDGDDYARPPVTEESVEEIGVGDSLEGVTDDGSGLADELETATRGAEVPEIVVSLEGGETLAEGGGSEESPEVDEGDAAGGLRPGETDLEYAARVMRRTEYRLGVAQAVVDDLVRQNALGRQRLEQRRQLELERLQVRREEDLLQREPEISARLEELEREIVDQEGIVDAVTRRMGTRGGEDVGCRLQLAAAAVAPAQAQSRRAGAKGIIGAVLGAALGLLLALAREGERATVVR